MVDTNQEPRQQEDLERAAVVMLRIDMEGIPLAQDKPGSQDIPCSYYTTESIGPERIWFYDGSNELWRPLDEWRESDPATGIAQWSYEWEQDEPQQQREPWIVFDSCTPFSGERGAFAPPSCQDELLMTDWNEQMESW